MATVIARVNVAISMAMTTTANVRSARTIMRNRAITSMTSKLLLLLPVLFLPLLKRK